MKILPDTVLKNHAMLHKACMHISMINDRNSFIKTTKIRLLFIKKFFRFANEISLILSFLYDLKILQKFFKWK